MDHRGRELREVGQALQSSWQALQASLLSRPVADHPPSRTRLRRPKSPTIVVDHEIEDAALAPLATRALHGAPAGRRLRKGAAGTIAAAVITLACLATLYGGRHVSTVMRFLPDVDAMARFAGFGIDQVTLTGYRFALDRDVFNALDLANVRSIVSLDAEAVKDRLERLPWIATAELKRVYPNRLEVRVTERKPFAVWARGDRSYLIDGTGRVLTALGNAKFPDLLLISGEGAATEAAPLMEIVARYPDIARRLSEAERVGERRWTLKLTGGVILKLPPDGEAHVLEAVARDPELGHLVTGAPSIIDFTAPGRVTVRAAEATPGAGPAAKTGS
jgi:cell division protein FtsQ